MAGKKGQIPWNKGKTYETDNRIARPHLGKHRSEETKKKISESLKGKKGYNKGHFVKKPERTKEEKKILNREKAKRWRRISPDKFKRCIEKYKENNKEHIEKVKNDWYEKNKDKIKEYIKDWRNNNKDKISIHSKKRRARKFGNGGSHTLGEWQTIKAQYNYTCPCCHRSEPEIKLTEDHIIPLSKGGGDNIENIQPLCKSCNCKKHTKLTKF